MLAGISSKEITEWQAYEQVHGPLGDDRLDYWMSLLVAVLLNAHRDPKKRSKPFKPVELLPYTVESDVETSPSGMLAFVETLNEMYGGTSDPKKIAAAHEELKAEEQ